MSERVCTSLRSEAAEVRVEGDGMSEGSRFISPQGEGCHCRIPVSEVWRSIPEGRLTRSCGSDVSDGDATPPEFVPGRLQRLRRRRC